MFKFDQTLLMFVQKDIEKGLIPMLLGEPGIGKSSWLSALADQMHTKCFVLACNQLADKADLTGARLVPTGNNDYKQVFYPHAVIHDAIEYAEANPRETPILFLDELNRTTPDVTSEALSIPTQRSIGSKSLPKNLRVVIAGNDKGNVTSLDEASISRFVLYHVMPDTQTFLKVNPELNPFIKNVLAAHPDVIFCKKTITVATGSDDDDSAGSIEDILGEGDEMNQITTPRTLSALSDFLNGFTNQELLTALGIMWHDADGKETTALGEAIVGHVGDTRFTSLLLDEIARSIATVTNQQNVQTVAKPASYDTLKAQPTRDAIAAFVATMTDNEKSGCMVYALYEQADNGPFIQALAAGITNLQPADMRVLFGLASTQTLDIGNVNALRDSGTPFAANIGAVLDSVGA